MSLFLLFRESQVVVAVVEPNTDGSKARRGRRRLQKENDELDLVLLEKRIAAKKAADKARQVLEVSTSRPEIPKINHEDEEEYILLTLH